LITQYVILVHNIFSPQWCTIPTNTFIIVQKEIWTFIIMKGSKINNYIVIKYCYN